MSFGFGFGLPSWQTLSGGFTPASLFSAGEQGAWYDPSDYSTLFTDSAGTTPVTAVEQYVGLMLDKSKGGVGTNGPQRYNLLTYTEQFDNAGWTKSNTTVAANSTTAPDGSSTADTLTAATTGNLRILRRQNAGFVANTAFTYAVYIKKNTTDWVALRFWDVGSGTAAWFNINTGAIGTTQIGCTASITNAGNGWYQCSITRTIGGSIAFNECDIMVSSADNSDTATAGDSIFIWGADLRLASQANLAPTYQRITDSWSATISGNHATSTGTKRPKLAARYNLLTYTEQFDNAAWTLNNILAFGSGSTANATTAPNGTLTADLITPNTSANTHRIFRSGTDANAQSLTYSVYVKTNGYTKVGIRESATSGAGAAFDLSNGTVIGAFNSGGGTASNMSITDAGNGWYRIVCTISFASATNQSFGLHVLSPSYVAGGNLFDSWTPNGTSGVYLWGADLRPASQATGLIGPTYQRVAAATDYDTVGFLPYLAFDGIDDLMSTGSIDWGGATNLSFFSGVRWYSDASQILLETTTNYNFNTGAVIATFDGPTQDRLTFGARTTAGYSIALGPGGTVTPITQVFSGVTTYAALNRSTLLRYNGTAVTPASSATDAPGALANGGLFIGDRSGGGGAPLNGGVYSLIVLGRAPTATETSSTESWVAGKTGVSL